MSEIDTEIRTALTEVRDAVEAPPVDRVALQVRVRAERRRRTTGRAAAGLLGVAAASVAVVGLAAVLRDTSPPTTDVAARPLANPQHLVGMVVEGKLVVGGPDGFDATEVPARNVLGDLTDLIVLTDPTGALVGVPVDGGRAGEPERLIPGVVDYAWLDSSGVLRAQRADGAVVRGTLRDGWETDLAPTGNLYLVDGRTRVESDEDGLSLRREQEVLRRIPGGGGVTDGSLAPGTLAVETVRGVRFYDATTGRRTAAVASSDGGSGRLSPDGSRYARVADGVLTLVDPRTGEVESVEGPSSYNGNVAWTSADTFVVVSRGQGGNSLWECGTGSRACRELYRDPSGTLKLHS
ncbi:hypothetical protein [Nocardioides sp. W7]|uniref:hypothetical protein n=1 Tax=Nocardioides sp. W7 TaxID=2931390 RepID=UPI001FD196FF|nr:hypothetical protein [Nocardioides sp. W7]